MITASFCSLKQSEGAQQPLKTPGSKLFSKVSESGGSDFDRFNMRFWSLDFNKFPFFTTCQQAGWVESSEFE